MVLEKIKNCTKNLAKDWLVILVLFTICIVLEHVGKEDLTSFWTLLRCVIATFVLLGACKLQRRIT